MIELTTPRGLPVQVPEHESEDPSPKFALSDVEGFRKYYADNGYVHPARPLRRAEEMWRREAIGIDFAPLGRGRALKSPRPDQCFC